MWALVFIVLLTPLETTSGLIGGALLRCGIPGKLRERVKSKVKLVISACNLARIRKKMSCKFAFLYSSSLDSSSY